MANERILIVDDDLHMQEVLSLYLQKNGFIVFTADDGLSALSIVEEEVPELIILDVMMPNLDGFELCQYIRRKTDVPILFFSSMVEDSDKVLGLGDRKSTRLNSSHVAISYAVFCLKKKNK